MPTIRLHVGEPGYQVREDWEYVEWAARVTKDAEDIRYSSREDRWREHVSKKYIPAGQTELNEAQLRALWDKGIVGLWERLPEVGVLPFTSYPRGVPHMGFYGKEEKHFISFEAVSKKVGWFVP